MNKQTQTILILAAVGIAAYFFLSKKDEEKPGQQYAANVPGAPAGSGLTETQQALGGAADIITAGGTAAANILNIVWPE